MSSSDFQDISGQIHQQQRFFSELRFVSFVFLLIYLFHQKDGKTSEGYKNYS